MAHFRALILFLLLTLPVLAQEKPPVRFSGAFQTGFASTFQLTLGGTYGAGPAWQNRVTFNVHNVFTKGDAVSVYGWKTLDLPATAWDWHAGIWYRIRPITTKRQNLLVSAGIQRWRFPSAAKGTQDWIAAANVNYTGRNRLTFWNTTDTWSLLHSNMPGGTLLHTQGGLQHRLLKHDDWSIVLRHGPAYTYSWNFYGKNDSRVIRYGANVATSYKSSTLEVYFRQQGGLQNGIPDNRYWSVLFTQNFGR